MSGSEVDEQPIRVLLADDQVLVRSGLQVLLENELGIEVVGAASDGAEAVDLARQHRPNVVLMDIRMPHVDGLDATLQITSDTALSDVKIVVLTTFDLDEYVYEALRSGASGFLLKHTEPGELVRAVRVVAEGEALLSPSVTRRLISAFAQGSETREPNERMWELLTAREREVVGVVAQGWSNDDIAAEWFVSHATVRTHVSRAMTKLQARDRAQLVVLAYRYGLARIPHGDGS